MDIASDTTVVSPEQRAAWAPFLATLLVAFGFGLLSNQVPDWEVLDGEAMWINELAAPYAALAWIAGVTLPRTRLSAGSAGVAAVLVAFLGYYTELLLDTGGSPFTLLGTANPWLVLELALGVSFGILGRAALRHPRRWMAVVAGLVPVLEAGAFATGLTGIDVPVLNLYPPTYPWSIWNTTFWCAEALVGAAVFLLLRHRWLSRAGTMGG